MSLDRVEQERTGEELRAHHQLAGLSDEEVCAHLGLTALGFRPRRVVVHPLGRSGWPFRET